MSFNRYLSALVGTASTIALIYAQPALAQQTAQSDQPAASTSATGLEEVVVTARRREEKAQTVPITMTTFTEKALENQNIHSATDLDKDTPSIQLCCAHGSVSFAWIRGIPGVLGYFNQLPASLNGASMYYDLASLQILKGPQGTLFGVSTNGGAILFESKKPTNDYEGYVQLGAGNYGHVEGEGAINIPIVPDKLLVRAGGQLQKTDGYVHDLKNNRDFYDENYGVGRVSVTFLPTDNIRNDLVVQYYQSHNNTLPFVWTTVNPAGLALALGRNLPFTGVNGQVQTGFINAFNQQLSLGKYEVLGTDSSGDTYANTSQWNITNTTSWDLNDDLTVKNFAGYQEIQSIGRSDTDGTPFNILDSNTIPVSGKFAGIALPTTQETPNTQYTEELQLQGRALNDRLTFTIGTFNQITALRSPNRPGYSSTLYNIQTGGNPAGALSYSSARADAVYAQGTYDLSDFVEGLSFTGGYRYNWDKKEFRQDTYSSATGLITASVGVKGNFHAPTYTLGFDYKLTPTTMFYVTDSKGYTTGGFNPNATPDVQLYLPETLDNVEIGVKSDWEIYGVKAQTNLSAFYGFYDNVQTVVPVVLSNGLLSTLTSNAATAHIQGVETELTVIPVEPLILSARAAYNDNKYDIYKSAATVNGVNVIQNLDNTPFTSNPRWNLNLRATYHLPVDAAYGDVALTAIWSYQSRQSSTPALPRLPTYDTPGFDNLDLNLDWNNVLGNPQLTGTAYGTNVLGNVRTNGPFQVYSAIGIYGIIPAAPPMFGVRLRYDFGPESAPQAAATAAYVPPAPQPVQPAAPKSYLVFFDFDKSDLTSAGRQIVDQAASNAPAAKVTQIAVTGHTDTVGSDEYNMRLSKRRALSVAAELEAHGIPESEIAIVAKGKRDPLVPTGDGVREPQNRRVEIVYGGGASS